MSSSSNPQADQKRTFAGSDQPALSRHVHEAARDRADDLARMYAPAPESAADRRGAVEMRFLLLSLLLAILEVDLHRADLHLMGLMSDGDQVDPIFLSLVGL